MDYQAIYDDLYRFIKNMEMAIDDIDDEIYMKDYIDRMNELKFDAENELEEIGEKLEEERKKEENRMNYEYERSVL